MSTMDLRPLSLGEILDRTFTLYRRHFLLFLGISAIPQVLVLALNLARVIVAVPAVPPTPAAPAEQFQANPALAGGVLVAGALFVLLLVVVTIIAILLSQGATVFAVSDLYLGNATTIGQSFRRMRGELGTLFGVVILSGLAAIGGFILLIIPGIYIACRLAVAVPASLLEGLGPRDSLSRSFALTKENAGRVFLIYLLYYCLALAAATVFQYPFTIAMAASLKNPEMLRVWTALMQVGSFAAGVLITPVLTIATSLLYYDLRVRKEAFDLQMLMGSLGGSIRSSAGVPHTLS